MYYNNISIVVILLILIFIYYLLSIKDLESMQDINRIPKHIYMSHKNIIKFDRKRIDKWQILNPDYDIHLYDDKECYRFILDNYGLEYAQFFLDISYGPIKSDFWRLLILYNKGGVYIDADMVPIVPINEILQKDTDIYLINDLNNTRLNPTFIATLPNVDIFIEAARLMYKYRYDINNYWKLSITNTLTIVLISKLPHLNIEKYNNLNGCEFNLKKLPKNIKYKNYNITIDQEICPNFYDIKTCYINNNTLNKKLMNVRSW